MRYVDGRDAQLLLDGAYLVAERDANLGIERGEGFVEQQKLGADRQGAGEGDALLLAAGELIGVAVAQILQLDQGQ